MAGKKWTESEIVYVKENFENMSCEEMAANLPGRTTRSVQHLFASLGLKRTLLQPGDKRGRLTILETWYEKHHKQNKQFALAKCDCGNVTRVIVSQVSSGNTRSCGCWTGKGTNSRVGDRETKHGLSHHKLYGLYNGIIGRCTYPSHCSYHNYGGRGIFVCEEWLNDFVSFFDWAIENGWEEGLTIDRIDPNGNYCPNNCRFVTVKVQANNKRNNRLLTAFGETKTVANWFLDDRCAAKSAGCICHRIKLGWDHERAITTPTRKLDRVYK